MKNAKSILLVGILLIFAAVHAEAGEYFNKHLPDWFKTDVQFRHRYEYQENFDFNDAAKDNHGFSLIRTRITLQLIPDEHTKVYYQFQDSRIAQDSKGGSKAGFEDHGETRQLWAEYKTDDLPFQFLELSGIGLRFGRQELSYGAQRLIGGFNWSNIAQTFDAGRVTFKFEPWKVEFDVFGGGKTPNKSPEEKDDFYDGAQNDRLGGMYMTHRWIDNIVIEEYIINRNTHGRIVSYGQNGDGEVDDYTIGARLIGAIPDTGFDYEIEAAKQVGNSGSLDVDAQMVVAILGYTFDHDWKPRVSFEFDYASGDSDSTDTERETFDNLYPTNHIHYGYMDFASLQNINNYRLQIKANPAKKLNVQADWHFIFLDTADDNLYSAGRGIKRATVAGADSHVGNELDLKVKYQACEYANILVGYSHLFAGDYLKDTGTSDDADFAYIQTTLTF